MASVSMASINYLPDDLLVHILSFLPTKQAASTSVLSQRWRFLFHLSPNLDLDDSIFYDRDHIPHKSLWDFVDGTLAFGKHLKNFSLIEHSTRRGDLHSHSRWICNAMEHSVSKLHLAIGYFAIPSKVFTSTTLVKLSLVTSRSLLDFPSDTSLPALKVLFLDTRLFEAQQFSDVFLAACPALEDLTIISKDHPKGPFIISSKTIKRLSVTYKSQPFDPYTKQNSGSISLDTSSVVDLYYSDHASRQYQHLNFGSLAKATLDIYNVDDNDADVTMLINGMRNVKTLHLTASAVNMISVYCKGGLPVFNNLVELVFPSKKRGLRVLLPLLLENSPNLKTLVLSGLDRYTYNYTTRQHRFGGELRIPSDNQVKVLTIMEYQGSENDLNYISQFLLKMEFLEVVNVHVSLAMDDLRKKQLTKDLLELPTASSKLNIKVLHTP